MKLWWLRNWRLKHKLIMGSTYPLMLTPMFIGVTVEKGFEESYWILICAIFGFVCMYLTASWILKKKDLND